MKMLFRNILTLCLLLTLSLAGRITVLSQNTPDSLHVHADLPGYADSLQNLINSSKKNEIQQTKWYLELIDYYYSTNQFEKTGTSIEEAENLLMKQKDACLKNRFELLQAKYIYHEEGRKNGVKEAQRVVENARKNSCKDTEVLGLLFFASDYMKQAKTDSCLKYIAQARKIAESEDDSILILESMLALGTLYLDNKNPDESRKHLIYAGEAFNRHHKPAKAGNAFSKAAETYSFKGVFDSTLIYGTKAIALLEKSSSYFDLAYTYNIITPVYSHSGQWHKFIETLYKALKIAEKYEYDRIALVSFFNIGIAYDNLGVKEKANENYQLSLKKATALKDTNIIISSLYSLGLNTLDKDPAQGKAYLKRAYNTAQVFNNADLLVNTALGIAEITFMQGDLQSTQSYFDQVYAYIERPANKDNIKFTHIAQINLAQAVLYTATGQLEKAVQLLKENIKEAKKTNFFIVEYNSLYILFSTYEGVGDFENALYRYQQVKALEDSVNFASALEKLVTEDIAYEHEKIERIRQLEREKAELKQQIKLRRSRYIAAGSAIIAFALIMLSLSLYTIAQARKKRNEGLQERNHLIGAHNKELEELFDKQQKLAVELEISNATKDKMFSIISHDLMNSFNALNGYTLLLIEQQEIDEKERQSYYNHMHDSSRHLMTVIKNLFEWAKAQSGEIAYKPQEININNIINESIRMAEIQANKKGIGLIREFKEDMTINVDTIMIERIFYNLISNAIKFTPAKGEVKIGWDTAPNELICWVKDNGIGMTANEIDLVLKNTTKSIKFGTEGETGTGLGLSICQEFIKQHNGRMWIESEPDSGTQFYFSIPL